MKKKLSTLILASFMIASLSSCDLLNAEYTTEGTISFYDGTSLLGSITGTAANEISDADQLIIDSYKIKEDNIFDKWYSDSALTSSISINYYPYQDLDVYAKFLTDVTITLDPGDGAFDEGAQTTFIGLQETEITEDFPTPSKDNSTFDYWYYMDATEEVKFETKFFPADDLTLYAKYSDWPYLSFVTNVPGYSIDPIQLEPGTEVPTEIINLTSLNSRSDYDFRGWYTDTAFTNRFNFDDMPDEDTTIYAKFLQEHSIFFVTNVTDYTIDPIIGFEGDAIEAPDIDENNMIVTDKYFDGWYSDSAFAGDPYSFVEMPDSDLTLYAKWTTNPVITLYDVDGTTVLATLTDEEPGSTVDLTAYNPDHEHDDFLKWVENSGAEASDIIDPYNYVVPDSDINLYVYYRTNYMLTIDFQDVDGNALAAISNYTEIWGSYSISNPSSDVEAYLFDETAIDYKVLDYYDASNNEINFPYAISSDETLTAVIATNVSIYLKNTVGTALGNVSGYQTEEVVTGNVTYVDETTNNYVVYGIDTTYSADLYTYNFAYLEGDSSVQYVLSNKFPTTDITLVLVFNLLED